MRLTAAALILVAAVTGSSGPIAAPVAGADPNFGPERTTHRVTTLADSGPGSLRFVLESTSGPRDVYFDLAGVIELERAIVIRAGDVRILGETAPAPGITLRGHTLDIKRGKVLIRHLAVRTGPGRPGEDVDNRDGIAISGAPGLKECMGKRGMGHIILDHVSVTWAVDENVQLWGCNIHNVTISNSIIAEALNRAGHSKGQHSMGLLIGNGSRNILVYRNLFVSNKWRNPALAVNTTVAVVNNLIYNPGGNAIHIYDQGDGRPVMASIVENLVIRGPDTNDRLPMGHRRPNAVNPGTQVFELGNKTRDGVSSFDFSAVRGLGQVRVPPVRWSNDLPLIDAWVLEADLLDTVGPRYRDVTDRRLIDEVRRRAGSIKDAPPQHEWRGSQP